MKKLDAPKLEIPRQLSHWLEPLLNSFAFTRLANITFLGILSPQFAFLPRFPFPKPNSHQIFDGTRADHSIGVANVFLEIAQSLKLSERTKRYGLAWALLHDIGTWPLSHTGEAAFSDVTSMSSDALREVIIRGYDMLPGYLTVRRQLDQLRIDIDDLMQLYKKEHNALKGELSLLWKIVNSPLTPDTLEGMQRSGRVFQIDTPPSDKITASFVTDLFSDAFIESGKSGAVLEFWRAKRRIYRSFINSKKAIEFESEWSLHTAAAFPRIALAESLLLPENCIVSTVLAYSKKRMKAREKRYKPPLDYFISSHHARRRRLLRRYELDDLSEVLGKARIGAL
jgi:hypothetical protein